MIKLGEMQELEVVKKQDFGVYLKSSDDVRGDNRILLPIKQVPEATEIGDKINVFVYRDSNDRIIATVNRPRLVIGEIGYLKVVEMSKIGAFLNWGLEKDLFLPFKEQVGELKNGGEYMVGLYVDKSDRLCATMNLFHVLRTDSPYKVNDIVKGTVFSLKRGLGAMIAVEGKYLGLIHEGEILKPLHSGDEVELRVSQVKEDGKLDLSFKDAPKLQIDRDGDKIFNALAKNKGRLPLNDDSSPELINEKLSMSKGSFKKALGRLLKRKIIEINKEGINLVDSSTKKTEKDNYNKKPYSSRKDGGKDYYKKSDNSERKDNKNYSKKSDSSDKKDFKDNYKKSDSSDKRDYKDNYKKSENSDRRDFKDNYKKSDSSERKDYKVNYKKSDNSDRKDNKDNKDNYKKSDNSDRNKNNNKDYYKKDSSPKSNYSKKTNFNKHK